MDSGIGTKTENFEISNSNNFSHDLDLDPIMISNVSLTSPNTVSGGLEVILKT